MQSNQESKSNQPDLTSNKETFSAPAMVLPKNSDGIRVAETDISIYVGETK